MSSNAQVEANRRNSQKSTGPKTPEGKARARLNAVTHGLLCDKAVIEGEDAELFAEHCRSMKEALAPQGAMEELLADRIAAQAWRLRRATGIEGLFLHRELGQFGLLEDPFATGAFRREPPGRPPHPRAGGATITFFHTGVHKLDVLRRYERAIDQALHQALRDLTALQAARRKAAPPALPRGKELVDALARDPEASRILRKFVHDTRQQARREVMVELAAAQAEEARCHASPSPRGEACDGEAPGAPARADTLPANDAGSMAPGAGSMAPGMAPSAAAEAQVLVQGQVTEAVSGREAPCETKPIPGGASPTGRPDEGAERAEEELQEALAAAAAGA